MSLLVPIGAGEIEMKRRRWWFIGLALLSVAVTGCNGATTGHGAVAPTIKPRSAEPLLFAEKIPSCREWAEAANYYISLGETAGLARLQKDAAKHSGPFEANHRAAHLCRILFEGKAGKPLRRPFLGGLSLPYDTMPLSAWPEFPMVQQDGVWFILAERYMLAGLAEPLDRYVDYCQAAGRYRSGPVKLPSTGEAKAAVETLLNSRRWKAIKWTGKGSFGSYSYAEDSVIEQIRAQAQF